MSVRSLGDYCKTIKATLFTAIVITELVKTTLLTVIETSSNNLAPCYFLALILSLASLCQKKAIVSDNAGFLKHVQV
jgi:hypothetical protein